MLNADWNKTPLTLSVLARTISLKESVKTSEVRSKSKPVKIGPVESAM